MTALFSPCADAALVPDTPHSLSDGEHRWPVIDGIPFLRVGRDDLVRDAVACLDRDDKNGALLLLLSDQDDWWDGPVPDKHALRDLVQRRDALTLREAMALLCFGRVGDYFAHRWSDPTFLAGLALLEAHWNAPARAFELACGIGHFLREFERLGVAATGADVVFSKLWLARHWVVSPGTQLLCFDAAAPWPMRGARFDVVLCQDAFYFLEPKDRILAALRAATADNGRLLVGHIHNSARLNASAGRGVTVETLGALFPDALCYDDAELTRALAEDRAPVAASPSSLADVDAFAVAAGTVRMPCPVGGGIAVPTAGRSLRRNPLYGEDVGTAAIRWPSERYKQEYASLATYPATSAAPLRTVASVANSDAVRRREFVDLPERW